MTTTNWLMVAKLQENYPNSFKCLQLLVMVMADYVNRSGEKTLFGRDKGFKYYRKFKKILRRTLLALQEDGEIQDIKEASECFSQMLVVLDYFEQAFPNWQEAYDFAKTFFSQENEPAQSFLDELWDGSGYSRIL